LLLSPSLLLPIRNWRTRRFSLGHHECP
jgi:hypothetical protein